jgi:hypothetical protein
MGSVQAVNDFDSILVQVIYETVEYCLGEENARIICNYLEERGLPLNKVSSKPELFSEELRKILGFGSRQILCAASILEETILEVLCKKLEIPFDCEKPVNFPLQIRKLRETYINGGMRR